MSIFSKLFKGGGRGDEPPTDPAHPSEEDDDEVEETTVVDGPAMDTAPHVPVTERRLPNPPPPRMPPAPPGGAQGAVDGWRNLESPTPPLRAKARATVREVEPTPVPRTARRDPTGSTPREGTRPLSKVLYAGTPFERMVSEEESKAAAAPAPSTGKTPRPSADKMPPPSRTPRTTPRSTPRSKSVSKPAAASRAPATEESVLPETLAADVDAELDAIFEDVTGALQSAAKNQTPSERARAEKRDAEASRAMFLEVSAVHLRQAREALLALRHGHDPRAAIGPAIASIKVVHDAAGKIGEEGMKSALGTLLGRLREAEKANGNIGDAARKEVLAAWSKLPLSREQLDLEGEHVRREAVIVRSLLMQVPDLEKIGMEKMFAAGLGTLPALLTASADDISATTGIERSVSAAVVERAGQYVRDFGTSVAVIDRAATRTALEALLRTLRHEHEAFERAAAQWTDASFAEKRRRRAERARVLLQIDVVLALVGETDRGKALERLPVHRRIERLETFVKDPAAFGAAPA